MKILTPSLLVLSALALSSVCKAATYTTDLFTTVNPNTLGFQAVWSSAKTSGNVTQADLTDLTVRLLNPGPTLIYEDVVISGGVIQPIGGNPRTITDIYFDFWFEAAAAPSLGTLYEIRNALPANLIGSTGHQRIIQDSVSIPDDAQIYFDVYQDGALIDQRGFQILAQHTGVPEPSTYMMAIAGGVALIARRRLRF